MMHDITSPSSSRRRVTIHNQWTVLENPLILINDLDEFTRDSFRLASLQTLGTNLLLCILSGVRVESEKDLLVLKWVLLLDTGTLGA